ncbi:MAG: hypothetical protein ABL933_12890 [Methyloglobulus sp.]|nr:hypothetical protein [Methyloglobulus sp.]
MNTEPTDSTHKTEGEELQTVITPPQSKPQIYPDMNDRFKGAVIWLGLAFVVMVFLVQHFSGYS